MSAQTTSFAARRGVARRRRDGQVEKNAVTPSWFPCPESENRFRCRFFLFPDLSPRVPQTGDARTPDGHQTAVVRLARRPMHLRYITTVLPPDEGIKKVTAMAWCVSKFERHPIGTLTFGDARGISFDHLYRSGY